MSFRDTAHQFVRYSRARERKGHHLWFEIVVYSKRVTLVSASKGLPGSQLCWLVSAAQYRRPLWLTR